MKPDRWLKEEKQVAALWILALAVAVVGVALDQFRPPGGWIALELPALTKSSSLPSPESWTPEQRETALFGLGLDFLFLMIYPLFLSLLCGRAALRWSLPSWLARTSAMLSGLVLLAAPLDALENIGLYLLIAGDSGQALQWFITAVAAAKWLAVLTASGVGLLGLGVRLRRGSAPA